MICRICLGKYTDEFINLDTLDQDNIKIHEKLKFCVPEIICDGTQLPENVCNQCILFLQQMFKFKQMCINNTNILYKYINQLAGEIKSEHHYKLDLFVAMNDVKNIENTDVLSETEEKQSSEGVSMFSISLNQWDLFETKYTCRCVKEYNSFTENTSHLCQNCEGELHGFQLSKVKVGIAESRFNDIIKQSQLDSDDGNSIVSTDVTETNIKYEKGFDYNDFLLSKVHVNGVKKQIEVLSDENDKSFEEEKDIKPDTSLLNRKHNKNKVFSCPLCDKGYTRRYNLYNHYATHPESKFYYCDKCRHKFISEQEYNEHELTHQKPLSEIKFENIKKLSQTLPNIKATNDEFEAHSLSLQEKKPELNQSLNSSTESLTCSTCDKVFEHKSHLAIHLMTHVGKQEHKCNECGEEFFRKENLQSHKQVHKSNRKYQCDQCDKSYNYKSNLRRHKFTHGGKFLCSICSAQFARKDTLVEHIFQNHTKTNKEYPCLQCKKIFGHIDQLKTHELFAHPKPKHNKNKVSNSSNYSCKVCDKSFSSLDLFKSHEKLHKKIKKEPVDESQGQFCQICSRTYSIKTNMRKHMLTHSSGKIINCSVCHKEFTNMYLLRQHVRTHADELGFKCELCDKSYLTKSNLVRHMDVCHKI